MEIMLGVFCAMFAVAMVAVGLAAGFAIGFVVSGRPERRGGRKQTEPAAEIPAEEKKRFERMLADQDAFRQMMNYNQETAYGMGGTERGGDGR